jgi:hypothetical protein
MLAIWTHQVKLPGAILPSALGENSVPLGSPLLSVSILKLNGSDGAQNTLSGKETLFHAIPLPN